MKLLLIKWLIYWLTGDHLFFYGAGEILWVVPVIYEPPPPSPPYIRNLLPVPPSLYSIIFMASSPFEAIFCHAPLKSHQPPPSSQKMDSPLIDDWLIKELESWIQLLHVCMT